MKFVDRKTILAFAAELSERFQHPATIYLIREPSLVFEGWRRWSDRLEFAAEVADAQRAAFAEAVDAIGKQAGLKLQFEHPVDVIPLPEGFERRAIPIPDSAFEAPLQKLTFFHFDPYSVAFRYIARGDEQDYHLVLNYLSHGWIVFEKMDELLVELLERFSFDTIQQDPAEFRRKFKGLLQMWRSHSSGQ